MDSDDFVPFVTNPPATFDPNELSSSAVFQPLITDVRAPWMQFSGGESDYGSSSSSLVRLHNEILSFCEYTAPTKGEMAAREQVLSEIVEIVKQIWPTAIVKVFGSQMTKILTPTSDLDIAILNVAGGTVDVIDLLYDLEKAIREKGIVSYIEILSNAKVPIVKLDHKRSGISVDVCINNSSGLSTGKLVRGFVRDYPPLRPLTIVLKIFLSQRRLNETYGGGMGSFVLVTLIISFLQMRAKSLAHRKVHQSWNLGALLLEFFTLYGNTFNFVHTGISVSKGGFYFDKLRRTGWFNLSRPFSLALENPDDPEVDIGKNSFMMQKIRRAFEHGQQVLTSALIDNRVESFLSYLIRPDDPSLTGRPGPGLTTSGVSQISDSESENENENEEDEENVREHSVKKRKPSTDIGSNNKKKNNKNKSREVIETNDSAVLDLVGSDDDSEDDGVEIYTKQNALKGSSIKSNMSLDEVLNKDSRVDKWETEISLQGDGNAQVKNNVKRKSTEENTINNSKDSNMNKNENSNKYKKKSNSTSVRAEQDGGSSDDDFDGVVITAK